ncbi:hypothetical protein B9J77_04435 [candidate division NPL-UPA2 bacterium Unc8]|uniref:Uncharacterized protein n=1 Tax=candidate division NPL-UPA2 bacterium Unc8 TaxID=1980939 RepID=A0A399FU34_UNCN2|nr:hypothetical protein [Bacillota bacterium]RIH99827.1 MAG: hypothetical protein B9J77_04435 [candidate division NPL-UPA2 bacterium Unc8]
MDNIPRPRQAKRSEAEPEVLEKTVKSHDGKRTYHVKRIDAGHGQSYVVSMEVIAKDAARDILNKEVEEITRDIWYEIWESTQERTQ